MYEELVFTKEFIEKRIGTDAKIAIVLGSGMGGFSDILKDSVSLEYGEIPGFSRATVVGHKGRLTKGKTHNGTKVVVMQGRFHYYETLDMKKIIYPVRVLSLLGIKYLFLTNAAGGVNKSFRAGDFMVIRDHINLMGTNPLLGPNEEQIGPRFPDLSEAYSRRLINIAHESAKNLNIDLKNGVYVGFNGPSYETPAEIRMVSIIGGDAVGMSTVPEVIAANHAKMEVLAISCITNLAAGITNNKLDHNDVIDSASKINERMKIFFVDIIDRIGKLG